MNLKNFMTFLPLMVCSVAKDLRAFPATVVEQDPCLLNGASCIEVGEMPKCEIGKPVNLIVDARRAGSGSFQVGVNGGRVLSRASYLPDNRLQISFTPQASQMDYAVMLKFNGEEVPGSPFKCEIETASGAKVSGPALQDTIRVNTPTRLTIELAKSDSTPTVEIAVKNGENVRSKIKSKNNGSFDVEFTPKQAGTHQITVFQDGLPVVGSPFIAKVYDVSKVKVHSIECAKVGQECSFYVDTSEAGPGELQISISVNDMMFHNVRAQARQQIKMSFLPILPQTHLVNVKFNGELIPGSPVKIEVPETDAANNNDDEN